MKPHIICDIDGVLAEYIDLTGASEEEVTKKLTDPRVVVPHPRKSLCALRDHYTLTFATTRKHSEAKGDTYLWASFNQLYRITLDNLIVGTTTTTKPYLAVGMRAKYVIDDHPKVIDLMYKQGFAKACTPIYILRGRPPGSFPVEAENIEEAAKIILHKEHEPPKDWSEFAKYLNALHAKS